MKPVQDRRLQSEQQRRNEKRTHYLWKERGEGFDEVRMRFRMMVEDGRADENDDYIIFHWKW